jgi:hypothetical protein
MSPATTIKAKAPITSSKKRNAAASLRKGLSTDSS